MFPSGIIPSLPYCFVRQAVTSPELIIRMVMCGWYRRDSAGGGNSVHYEKKCSCVIILSSPYCIASQAVTSLALCSVWA